MENYIATVDGETTSQIALIEKSFITDKTETTNKVDDVSNRLCGSSSGPIIQYTDRQALLYSKGDTTCNNVITKIHTKH